MTIDEKKRLQPAFKRVELLII